MCFSAAASFSLAGVLTGIGALSLSQSSPATRLFAATPLIFAAQQAAEGTVWATMGSGRHATLHAAAINAFLAVALVVWPAWAPLATQRMERVAARRHALTQLTWFGLAVALGAAWMLSQRQPIARVTSRSIRYDYPGTDITLLHALMVVAYIVPTTLPFFLSTGRMARLVGGALILSVVVAVVVERDAFTSVWCFFAAVLSCLIVLVVHRRETAATVIPATPRVAAARR
jgi:hypothetical protein